MIPAPEAAYLEVLAGRLRAALGGRLTGVYLVGSGATGTYRPGPSDLDVWALVDGPLPATARRGLGVQLDHAALPCPARGLELVVAWFDRAAPQVQLNLNDGARMARRAWTDPRRMPASHWFVLDAAVARVAAVTLWGRPAREAFPPVPRSAQLAAVRRSLAWHRRYAAGSPDAVLNALRGARYAEEDTWCSKREAVAWAEATRPEWADEARGVLPT